MKIKILNKEYQCNKANISNKVYFEVDNKLLMMDIIYIPSKKANYLIETKENTELEKYIIEHYDIGWEIFLGAFFNELRNYSNHRNLAPIVHFNVSDIKYHEKENKK